MSSIARYPEVSVGRELFEVSQAIFADPHEIIAVDRSYVDYPFAWCSSSDFIPQLKVIAPGLNSFRKGGIHIDSAVMVLVEDGDEYKIKVEEDNIDEIKDDEFILDFVKAFRQYRQHPLLLSVHEREIALNIIGGNS